VRVPPLPTLTVISAARAAAGTRRAAMKVEKRILKKLKLIGLRGGYEGEMNVC
jgi:hypothetical protein